MPQELDPNKLPSDFDNLDNSFFDEPFAEPEAEENEVPEFETEPKEPWKLRDHVQMDNLPKAFWTITGVISLLTSAILLAILIGVGINIFGMISAINQGLVGELYTSFNDMDQAHILTTIPINAEVPAQFDLQLDTYTNVVLSEDVFIKGSNVSLSTGGLTISNAPTDITLPANTELPVHLILTVPVDEMIPVIMNVDVDIPINQTQLHEPFTKLQETIAPYYYFLYAMPDTMSDAIKSFGK